MTLDEAIIHAEEIAEINENIAYNTDSENWMDIAQCEKRAEEHRQLAEWLKELKGYQSVYAIEVVRCKDCKYAHMTYGGECKYCDMWKEDGEALYLDEDFFCAYGERKEP